MTTNPSRQIYPPTLTPHKHRPLPCPFCGQAPTVVRSGLEIAVRCCVEMNRMKHEYLKPPERGLFNPRTGAYPPYLEDYIEEQFIREWNRRAGFAWGGSIPRRRSDQPAARTGFCHLRIIRGSAKTVLVASEMVNNPGPGIVQGAESLWSKALRVCKEEDASPILVEHFHQVVSGGEEAIYSQVHYRVEAGRCSITGKCRTGPEEVAAAAGCDPASLQIPPEALYLPH